MPDASTDDLYPGERLGLPRDGRGSVARVGRRLGGLLIDWVSATIIATAFLGYSPWALPAEAGWTQFAPLTVFAVLQVLFIPMIGGSPGHRIVGLRLLGPGGGWTGVWRPIIRTVLLVLVVPALIWDRDRRGVHDRVAGTVLVRA